MTRYHAASTSYSYKKTPPKINATPEETKSKLANASKTKTPTLCTKKHNE